LKKKMQLCQKIYDEVPHAQTTKLVQNEILSKD